MKLQDSFVSILALATLLALAACSRSGPPAAATRYFCPMHPEIVSDRPGSCPICHMDLVPERDARAGGQMPPSADSVDSRTREAEPAVGATSTPPVEIARLEPLERTVRAVGTVRADEGRTAQIESRTGGWIVELPASVPGRRVDPGERLAVIESPDLWQAEAEWQLARRTAAAWQSPDSAAELERAGQLLLEASRKRLEWFRLPAERLAALEAGAEPLGRLEIRAPQAGFLLEVGVLPGARVEPGTLLFRLARLDSVWIEAAFFEADRVALEPGSTARVRKQGAPTPLASPARLEFVDPRVDAETRTVRTRFRIGNPGFELLPGQYVELELAAGGGPVLTVPEEAVLPTGNRWLVFVAGELPAGGQGFLPREVLPGRRARGRVEILSGLEEGERVAARGAFLLDSESRIRGLSAAATAPPPAAQHPGGHAP